MALAIFLDSNSTCNKYNISFGYYGKNGHEQESSAVKTESDRPTKMLLEIDFDFQWDWNSNSKYM